MKYKILQLDANGRISFTKEELEDLLEEVYNNGYDDGRKTCNYYPYQISPSWKPGDTPSWKPGDVWVSTDGTENNPNEKYKIHVGDDPNRLSGGTTTNISHP